MNFYKKQNTGITLISLIITIIVLLILAGVAIVGINGDGLIGKASKASIMQELKLVEEQVSLRLTNERLNKFTNDEEFNISSYTSLESFSPKIESKYSEYIRIDNGKIYLSTNAPEEIQNVAEEVGIPSKDIITNIKIYGNSIQDGTPSPENPVEIQSVGDLVTNTNDHNYGKYKIPIAASGKNLFDIYLDEPLRKVGDVADYIDFSTGKVIRNISKHEFTGNEKWSLQSINSNNICNFSTSTVGEMNREDYISNRFIKQITIIADTIDEGIFYANATAFYIRISSERAPTLTEFKKWLELNNTKVYVQLPKGIEETVDLPNISTLKEMKNITVETQIQPSELEIIE